MDDRTIFWYDLKKYGDYFFETKGFTSGLPVNYQLSEQALQAAQKIRGPERGPAVIIQGIMPRSGTVYAGELLRLHPDLYAYPQHLWEIPALQLSGDILNLQKKFLLGYKPNIEKLGGNEFFPLFGASILAYLMNSMPPEQRLLIKMPSVQYLNYFFLMFPYEHLLILLRDGRDVVHSTLRTWSRLNFPQVCLRWRRSAQAILAAQAYLKTSSHKFWIARYEDALQEPVMFAQQACQHFGLDAERYPYEKIDAVRVIGSSSKIKKEDGKLVWKHVEKSKDFKPLEYWRKWSAAKKLIFKMIAGRSLIQLGYCEDSNW